MAKYDWYGTADQGPQRTNQSKKMEVHYSGLGTKDPIVGHICTLYIPLTYYLVPNLR